MSWEMVKLGDVAKIGAGQSAPKDSDFTLSDGLPFIRAGHLEQLIANDEISKLPSIGPQNSKKNRLKVLNKGSILFAKSGMSAMMNRVYLLGQDAYYVSHLASVTPNNNVLNSSFCYYFLRHFKTSKLVKDSAYPSIGLPDIEKVKIPLPPLPIQKRIAEILDAADALKRKDQELLKKYDELAQAIFIDMFGDPVKNEKGWEVKTIRNIALKISDGPFGSNLKTEHYSNDGVRVIRLKNIGVNSFNDEDSAFVKIQHYENVIKKYTCVPGDILIGTLGEPNLRACIFPSYLDKAVNKADCVMLRIKPEICNQIYVTYFLNIPSFVESVANKLHGQTRTRISMGQVASLSILIPPKSLQDKFSNLITNLKSQNDFTTIRNKNSNNLFQTLIQKAFKGELVN